MGVAVPAASLSTSASVKLNVLSNSSTSAKLLNRISVCGGKRPILIPSIDGLMIDLAAITPFFQNIFFGLRKAQQYPSDQHPKRIGFGDRGRSGGYR
jgi:hypothetical protein